MKNRLVSVPSIRTPIMPAPGFAKKGLAHFKLDLMALCGFGCSYCSSNAGNYLRINREAFADRTEEQLGERLYPDTAPELAMLWPDVLEKLDRQTTAHKTTWGWGKTLVFSMLTDGFSPVLVGNGTTLEALRLVLARTSFRIRVLTKNAVVGSERWVKLFSEHPGRFVVGLSCGTLDGSWAERVEKGTSSPKARVAALRALQDAGVPTYGMLCPVFPDVLSGDGVEKLVREIRPELCETVWAEPYNDRTNWQRVRAGYAEGGAAWEWFTKVYGSTASHALWSVYAAKLYSKLRAALAKAGSEHKLRYLLYEDQIRAADAPAFAGLDGVLLQSKPLEDGPRAGYSANQYMAELQDRGPMHGRAHEAVSGAPRTST